jgi:uncharacterized protein YnzC (UPF0291/DUF896 family)
MDGLRMLHAQNPDIFTTPLLANRFRISPEAVRRILKSKWEPTKEKRQKLAVREKMETQQRLRRAYLEEAKGRIETIMAKKSADAEESELYWSKQDLEKRIEAEKRSRRGHRPGFGQQFGRVRSQLDEQRPQKPKKDLFFS